MKYKAIFFDCDGVLIFGYPWMQMEIALGIPEEKIRQLWKDYYAGKITYDHWNKVFNRYYHDLKLTRKIFEKYMGQYHINPEAPDIIDFLKGKRMEIAIISSGADFYVQKVARQLGIEHWRANYSFEFDKDGNFVKMRSGIEDPKAKVQQVKEICDLLKIIPTETIFVGDSDNDLAAFRFTQHGVLYKDENEDHKKHAWKTIQELDELKDFF